MEGKNEERLTQQLTRGTGDKYKVNQVHFQLEKEFNFEEDVSLNTTRITSTYLSKGKTAYIHIDLS